MAAPALVFACVATNACCLSGLNSLPSVPLSVLLRRNSSPSIGCVGAPSPHVYPTLMRTPTPPLPSPTGQTFPPPPCSSPLSMLSPEQIKSRIIASVANKVLPRLIGMSDGFFSGAQNFTFRRNNMGNPWSEMPLFRFLKEFRFFQHLPKFKKNAIDPSILLQMIIDIA